VVGTGTEATTNADSVAVTYAGWLKDGTLFDLGTNIRFDLDNVVKGFKDGVIGMKVGGKRKLVIPSELGYGNRARRTSIEGVTIPRQSTLVFDVELLNVFNPAP
jgi:FKBP-type peptidyl-prolyl cis-trans isomerase FkpA